MGEVNASNVYKNLVQTAWNSDKKSFCPLRKEKQMEYLFSFLENDFKKKNQKILDTCCGYGRLIYFLNEFDALQRYVGIDYVEELVEQGRKLFLEHHNVTFECYDVLTLSNVFKEKEFDITINYKTLSWLPYYETLLQELVKVTKHKIYISSLFYDGDIDFITKIYSNAQNNNENYSFLNTYSLPKFKNFCESLKIKKINVIPMELDFDLPKNGRPHQLQTFTILTKENTRIEVTGNIILHWKLIELVL